MDTIRKKLVVPKKCYLYDEAISTNRAANLIFSLNLKSKELVAMLVGQGRKNSFLHLIKCIYYVQTISWGLYLE